LNYCTEDQRASAPAIFTIASALKEALRLRVKDVDFDKRAIIVREAKGINDRVVMLPMSMPSEGVPVLGVVPGIPATPDGDRSSDHTGITSIPSSRREIPG
jgi:hypothetical protein